MQGKKEKNPARTQVATLERVRKMRMGCSEFT